MVEGPWLNEAQTRMWRAFLDVHRRLEMATEQQLAEHGLSHADYALLVPLSETPGGVLRVRDLGLAAAWDRSRLSHQLRRMSARGLVSRFNCETDARGTMVRLEPAGRRAIEAAAPGHVATVRQNFVDLLEPNEIDTLAAIFTRLRDELPVDAATLCKTSAPDVEARV
jgi:DNA-binding MarR family transcriptional regulator